MMGRGPLYLGMFKKPKGFSTTIKDMCGTNWVCRGGWAGSFKSILSENKSLEDIQLRDDWFDSYFKIISLATKKMVCKDNRDGRDHVGDC